MTVSHPRGGRLPLLSGRPAVTFPTAQHHRHLAGTKLYCLVTKAGGLLNLLYTAFCENLSDRVAHRSQGMSANNVFFFFI